MWLKCRLSALIHGADLKFNTSTEPLFNQLVNCLLFKCDHLYKNDCNPETLYYYLQLWQFHGAEGPTNIC